MKKLASILVLAVLFTACGGGNETNKENVPTASSDSKATDNENPSYDAKRGEGKFTKVEVGESLDVAKATEGEKVYSVKCSGCHKLSEERLVGPGWKGVTVRHTPEWIMNFATNTDAMLNKDPKAQAQLEICLVRMPNQNIGDDDARNLYEFMRKVDGVK